MDQRQEQERQNNIRKMRRRTCQEDRRRGHRTNHYNNGTAIKSVITDERVKRLVDDMLNVTKAQILNILVRMDITFGKHWRGGQLQGRERTASISIRLSRTFAADQ